MAAPSSSFEVRLVRRDRRRTQSIGRILGMWVNIFVSAPISALVPLLMAVIGIGETTVVVTVFLFAVFVIYGLSGYVLYGWRKAKGLQTSVISTSTDEPEESGLHR